MKRYVHLCCIMLVQHLYTKRLALKGRSSDAPCEQGLQEQFGKFGRVAAVSILAQGDSCNEPAAKVIMESVTGAADAIDSLNMGQGHHSGFAVRYAHPLREDRSRLKQAARAMSQLADIDDDSDGEYE